MPYACHKCGSMIEEGTAFCPHCGAPQIRVSVPAGESPTFAPGTPAEMQPPAKPVPLPSSHLAVAPGAINWRDAFPSVAIAGVLTGLASWLPLGVLWLVAGGAFAVFLYRRRHRPAWPLTSGTGAKIGLATGFIAYLVFSIIGAVDFTRPQSAGREMIRQALQQAASRNSDPTVQEMYRKMTTPEGMAVVVTFIMAFLFVFFLGLGAAGGAIGAVATARDRRSY